MTATLREIWARWKYLPRLVALAVRLGPIEMSIIAVTSVAGGLIPVAAVAVLRILVDTTVDVIEGDGELSTALFWLAALLGTFLLERVYEEFQDLRRDLQDRLTARAREMLIAKASRVPLAMFEQPEFYDRLHRANESLQGRVQNSMTLISSIPASIVRIVGLLAFVATAHPVFPLILAVSLVPLYIVETRVGVRIFGATRQHTPDDRRRAYLEDLMTNREAAAEVRLFGQGEYLLERRERITQRLRGMRMKIAKDHFTERGKANFGEHLAVGVVFAGIAALIVQGRLTVGYFAAFIAAVERLQAELSLVLANTVEMDVSLRYVIDLLDYLDMEVEDSQGREEGQAGSALGPAVVRFEGVTFAYPGSTTPVLRGVDLELRAGERVALVGRNGAGKSTMAKLLLGLYRPTSGRISVDGVDMNDIEPSEWRRRVAAVFQDYMRFEITARENVGYGALDKLHDIPAIEAASVKAGAASFVQTLPHGYETVLGRSFDKDGQDPSAGQWQRLASARAYMREASVLVLDEPTAALDARAEVEVYRRFRDMSQGKAVLLISHRLGSARLADRIVFLDDGRITEHGTHAYLMERGGEYARLYSIQAEWYR